MNEQGDQKGPQLPSNQTVIAERLQGERPKPTEAVFPALPGVGIDLLTLSRFLVQCGYFQDVRQISQAAVKVLLGQELGIPPIRSMMDVYLVSGRPAIGSSIMAAKIKGSGRYNYRIAKHDDSVCEIRILERGVGNVWEEIGVSVFTVDDAERAGLLKKGGSWATYRRNMLFARAISNAARWHTPDLFGGAVYTPEELDERSDRSAPAKPNGEPTTSPQAASAVEALAAELEKLGPEPAKESSPIETPASEALPESTGTLFDGPVGPTPEIPRKRQAGP